MQTYVRKSMALVCGGAITFGAVVVQAQSLTSIRIASGLSRPLHLVSPPGDTERLFVLEQTGRIRIIKNGELLPTPFVTISVRCCGDMGLLGLAFHRGYDDNGFIYVDYSRPGDGDTVIARYKVSDNNPDIADPNSAMKLLTIDQPASNHNGGWIGFGPDGYLYIAMGDGGGSPGTRPQDKQSLLGKVLRIDVNGDDFPQDPNKNYAIPPDNPFVGKEGRDEIWALGLRNPWRCGFDRATGDLFIGDVGSGREEVDFQPADSKGGENYGWPCMDGRGCGGGGGCTCNAPELTLPIHDYTRGEIGCSGVSVMGGYVYRGGAMPDLQGTYFFGDYCSRGPIWSFRYDGKEVSEFTERTTELKPRGGFQISPIVSFGEDGNGELYICDLGGEVFKIILNAPPCEDIKKFKSKCTRSGKVKTKVKLKNADHDGKSVAIGIADDVFNVEVKGKKAKLAQCCYNGPTTVSLIDPGDCKPPKEVDCP